MTSSVSEMRLQQQQEREEERYENLYYDSVQAYAPRMMEFRVKVLEREITKSNMKTYVSDERRLQSMGNLWRSSENELEGVSVLMAHIYSATTFKDKFILSQFLSRQTKRALRSQAKWITSVPTFGESEPDNYVTDADAFAELNHFEDHF